MQLQNNVTKPVSCILPVKVVIKYAVEVKRNYLAYESNLHGMDLPNLIQALGRALYQNQQLARSVSSLTL